MSKIVELKHNRGPCGHLVLREEIQVGTKYRIETDSERPMDYYCGFCKTTTRVMTVLCSSVLNPESKPAPMLLSIFE